MPSTKEKKKEVGSGQLPATQPQPEAPEGLQPTQVPALIARTPEELVQRAQSLAKALIPIIEKQHLYSIINDRKFVRVEAWTTLGAMLNIFPYVEFTRRVEGGNGITWESRVLIKNLDGQVISSAEAMCSSEESNWRNRPEFSIRSMAQTRAVSKALRLPLAFIVTLAGYEATPAEEMESGWHKDEKSNGVGQAVAKLIKEHPLPKDFRTAFHKNLTDWKLTPEQAKVIIANHLKIEDPKKIKFAGNTKEMLTCYNAILLHYRMQEKKEPEGKQEVKEPKKSQKAKKPAASSSPEKLTDLKKRVLGFIPEDSAMPNDLTLPVTKWAEMQFKKLGDVKGLKEVIPFVRLYLPAEFKAELRKYPEFQGALGGGLCPR